VTDFEQLCEGLEVEHPEADHPEADHPKEDHPEEEAEAQDQSPPLLPKAPYWQLPPET